ncbi:MAG TPA: hypothetical protein PLU35_10115 [Phycisphaerales bacterium]|nr:hypothetical protein [Phycisphaerales bacterium]
MVRRRTIRKSPGFPRPTRGGTLVLAATLTLAAAGHAVGQTTTTWTSVLDGDWSDPGNWDNGAPLDDTFNALIDLGGVYIVSLDSSFTINDFRMAAVDGRLDLLTNKLTLNGTFDFIDSFITSNPAGGEIEVLGDANLSDFFLQRSTLRTQGKFIIDSASGDDICDSDIDHRGSEGAWRGSADLGFRNGGSFTIADGAGFAVENDQRMFWTGIGGQGSFTVEGTLTKAAGSGETFIEQITFTNNGTVRVESATLRADTVANVTGNTLAGGAWEVVNGSTLRFDGVSILTNQADVLLAGTGATFLGFEGVELNDAGGRLAVRDAAVFTTGGPQFENLGVLEVGTGSRFEVQSGTPLVNFSAGTLSDGEFIVAGTLAFDGAAITTVASRLVLDGAASDVVDSSLGGEPSGLTGLHTVAAGGEFAITNGRDFTTEADMTVDGDGALTVGPSSRFRVAPGSELTNFSAGVFTGGVFNVKGELVFDNADVERIASDLTLDGPDSKFLNENEQDGLQNLSVIESNGRLALLNGRTLETLDSLTVEGELFIGDTNGNKPRQKTSLTINGDLVQEGGRASLGGGDLIVIGVYHLIGAELSGEGRVTAELVARAGPSLSPGAGIGQLTIIGDLITHDDAALIAEIAILAPGGDLVADRLRVRGTVFLDPDNDGHGAVLDLRLSGDSLPLEGDYIRLIVADALEGRFGTVLGAQIDDDLFFKVVYSDRGVGVRVVPAPTTFACFAALGLLAGRRRRA